jgi:signal peptidase II
MFSYGMFIGGIVGNLVDRVFRNYVIDFLSFNIFGYHFPVFNIADCFIVISIFLIVIESLLKEGKK